jgi:hypothetical protein
VWWWWGLQTVRHSSKDMLDLQELRFEVSQSSDAHDP